MDEEILTLPQVLKLLPIGDDKLRRMAKANEIPCRKVGGRYLFIKSDLVAWIREGYANEVAHTKRESVALNTRALSAEYDRLLAPRLKGAALTKALTKALERTPSKKR